MEHVVSEVVFKNYGSIILAGSHALDGFVHSVRELPAYLVVAPHLIKDFLSHVDMAAVLKVDAGIIRRQSDRDVARVGVRVAVCVDVDPRVERRKRTNGHYNSQRKKAPAHCLYIIFKYGNNGFQILYLQSMFMF